MQKICTCENFVCTKSSGINKFYPFVVFLTAVAQNPEKTENRNTCFFCTNFVQKHTRVRVVCCTQNAHKNIVRQTAHPVRQEICSVYAITREKTRFWGFTVRAVCFINLGTLNTSIFNKIKKLKNSEKLNVGT